MTVSRKDIITGTYRRNRGEGALMGKKLLGTLLPGVLACMTALNPIVACAQGNADGAQAADYLLDNQKSAERRIEENASDASFPEKFDLRDKGVVTPVKFQNPWGTCWGFAAIAAAETSILSSLGTTYEETGLDLSEHHLAYFARSYMNDGTSQDGEGIHMVEDVGMDLMNAGGMMFTATSVFSSGIGVVDEDTVPYRGKESKAEGFLHNVYYSESDDWTIPDDYKFLQRYELINSDILPSPAVYSADCDIMEETDLDVRNAAYIGYDQSATDTIKKVLMEGKAVSVAFAADTYLPSDAMNDDLDPVYLNTEDNKWTHYAYDSAPATHAVTIVGWDDTIKSTDFLDHSDDVWGDGNAYQPEGDGAWIVKNSWGADTEEFPNKFSWGIENEEGQATGYFYISYYDRSLAGPEIFEFDTSSEEKTGYIIDQYDYLQSDGTSGWISDGKMKMANVFMAEYDEELESLSCETDEENADVEFAVYLLDDNAASPEDGQLAATASGSFEYAGYHRVDVDNPVHIAKGQKYSVVVTQHVSLDGEDCYAVSTNSSMNSKSYVEEYNRQVHYENRGSELSDYEEDLLGYYSVGVVNPGESYFYAEEAGDWTDFSDVVAAIQEDPEYTDYVYDNFPIKAYLAFADEAEMNEETGDELPELGYAEPAGSIHIKTVVIIVIVVLVIVLLIVLKIRKHRKWRRMKKQLAEQAQEIARLQEEVRRLMEQTTAEPKTAEACQAQPVNVPDEGEKKPEHKDAE